MKFLVSLFLLFFMLDTSFSAKEAWIITEKFNDEKYNEMLTYSPKSEVDKKEAYIFSEKESSCGSIIYLVGTETTPYKKVMAAIGAACILEQMYNRIADGAPLYFTRKTSHLIHTFGDVLENNEIVLDNTPRLYRVEADSIIQIQLDPERVHNMNAFVLHDGYKMTVYYPALLDKTIKKLTVLFSDYIVKFEETKYNTDVHRSILYGRTFFDAAYEEFIKKIKAIVKLLSKNDLENIGTVQEEFNANINNAPEEDKIFETIRRVAVDDISNSLSQRAINSDHLRSGTASTSTDSGRRKKAVTREGNVNSSFVLSTPSTAVRFIYERPFIVLGPPECQLEKGETMQFETFRPACVYLFSDFTNNELLVYLGKGGKKDDYTAVVTVAEAYYLHNNPSAKITYICHDGYPIPPHFMIYFKSELRKLLET